ncbi:MAG: hypothetical protein WD470_07195 [Rhodospirillaceae bacterium]
MSRGPGKMQRAILDVIAAGEWRQFSWLPDYFRGRRKVIPQHGFVERVAVSRAVAYRLTGGRPCDSPAFRASFSRAWRGLVKRGILAKQRGSVVKRGGVVEWGSWAQPIEGSSRVLLNAWFEVTMPGG